MVAAMRQVKLRILLVSSSGGVLLDVLALESWWSRHDPVWVSVPAPDTTAALAGHRVHWQIEQSARRPWRALAATARAWTVLRRERPDVLVSAGTGVSVGFFIAARLRGVPSIWLETFNMVGRPGLAARICMRLAARVLVQRPELAASRPNAVLVGELY